MGQGWITTSFRWCFVNDAAAKQSRQPATQHTGTTGPPMVVADCSVCGCWLPKHQRRLSKRVQQPLGDDVVLCGFMSIVGVCVLLWHSEHRIALIGNLFFGRGIRRSLSKHQLFCIRTFNGFDEIGWRE